jgi:serine protease SohB
VASIPPALFALAHSAGEAGFAYAQSPINEDAGMESFWLAYGLFIAKTVSLLTLIVIAMVLLARLRRRTDTPREHLQVKKLNDKFQAMTETLQRAMLLKPDLKQYLHDRKQSVKQARRSAEQRPRVFVLEFKGDLRASAVRALREEVTAVLTVAKPRDEVFLRLESLGGLVMSYGLAASQLARIKQAGIPLVAAVDQVAASGGYLMACVADRILAAPFAIIGSIGVVAQMPNFHALLKKHDIDYELHTAGEYKRTLTVFGENTEQGRAKLKEEIEETHALFKQFLAEHRPHLDIAAVATGEHWLGTRALDLKLVDELITSDDYLLKRSQEADLYSVRYPLRRSLVERLGLSRDKAAF